MEILGIGLPEILFVLLIAVIVLGPRDMTQAARTVGRFLRSVVTSEWWQSFKTGVQEVRRLPYQLMREAGMEEDWQAAAEVTDLRKRYSRPIDQPGLDADLRRHQAWTDFSRGAPMPDLANTILPPGRETETPEAESENPSAAAQEDRRDPPQADAAG